MLDFNKYVTINHDDLYKYLIIKKVAHKKLSAKTNIHLLNIIIAMVTYRDPKGVIGRLLHLYGKSNFVHILDNKIGTLVHITHDIKCKVCKKNKAFYEHVTQDNFYLKNKPCICNECLKMCIKNSNDFLFDLSLPSIFKLYCQFKQTSIYQNLVNDVSYKIFWLSL
jgi:hypothetical protein